MEHDSVAAFAMRAERDFSAGAVGSQEAAQGSAAPEG